MPALSDEVGQTIERALDQAAREAARALFRTLTKDEKQVVYEKLTLLNYESPDDPFSPYMCQDIKDADALLEELKNTYLLSDVRQYDKYVFIHRSDLALAAPVLEARRAAMLDIDLEQVDKRSFKAFKVESQKEFSAQEIGEKMIYELGKEGIQASYSNGKVNFAAPIQKDNTERYLNSISTVKKIRQAVNSNPENYGPKEPSVEQIPTNPEIQEKPPLNAREALLNEEEARQESLTQTKDADLTHEAQVKVQSGPEQSLNTEPLIPQEPSPANKDIDGDGIKDTAEDLDGDGLVDDLEDLPVDRDLESQLRDAAESARDLNAFKREHGKDFQPQRVTNQDRL